jgi:hypothetical protein
LCSETRPNAKPETVTSHTKMTRHPLLWTIFLASTVISSCDNSTKQADNPSALTSIQTIPEIQLPLKIRCDNFPRVKDSINFSTIYNRGLVSDTATYFGKITRSEWVTIIIKNRDRIQSPILYSFGKYGEALDTLVLFDKVCFVGVDSQYLPWIEITKDLRIIRTDTSYYMSHKLPDQSSPKKRYTVVTQTTDTIITTDNFFIDHIGYVQRQKNYD